MLFAFCLQLSPAPLQHTQIQSLSANHNPYAEIKPLSSVLANACKKKEKKKRSSNCFLWRYIWLFFSFSRGYINKWLLRKISSAFLFFFYHMFISWNLSLACSSAFNCEQLMKFPGLRLVATLFTEYSVYPSINLASYSSASLSILSLLASLAIMLTSIYSSTQYRGLK